jgi:hypothetical protein
MYDKLTEDNFLIYAAKFYDNPQCQSTEEFLEDLKRIKYIKKLITRYIDSGELKERLILNHLIVLNNLFGPEPLCRILFLKMKQQMRYIKPFLLMLNILPEKIYNVGEFPVVETDLIPIDEKIVEALRVVANG